MFIGRGKRLMLAMCLFSFMLLISGCTGQQPSSNEGGMSAAYDPENAREYGMQGIYLGQGIKEAIDILKPKQYEFMDVTTRETLTVEQMAQGSGRSATGIIMLDSAQLMLKVQDGLVASIIMGGAPESEGQKYKTNRGVALYDSLDQVKKLYGDTASTDKELIYKGSKYQMLFSMYNGKVIGFRFDQVEGQ